MSESQSIRVALLDLYNGDPNLGIGALRRLVEAADAEIDASITLDLFATRAEAELPDLEYDVYISSGGPGSPFDGDGLEWERLYFQWLDALWQHNLAPGNTPKRALFICHSFQMMCRHFKLGDVTKRHEPSFGVHAVALTDAGTNDPLLDELADPFFAADFRAWQVVNPDLGRLSDLGASILAIEPDHRSDGPSAVMGIRMSDDIVGVQFHPEANPEGMMKHFTLPERHAAIVDKHGEEAYGRLIRRLNDTDFLSPTYSKVVPTFLRRTLDLLGQKEV